jgi:hypothetical protein
MRRGYRREKQWTKGPPGLDFGLDRRPDGRRQQSRSEQAREEETIRVQWETILTRPLLRQNRCGTR